MRARVGASPWRRAPALATATLRAIALPFATVGALALGAAPLCAQSDSALAAVGGTVIDAENGRALEGVTVTLEPLPAGLLPAAEVPAGGFAASARQVVTGPNGSYRFAGLAAGGYRLLFVRIGYRSRILEVQYEGPAGPRLSVGMRVEPVELEPVDVVGTRAQAVTLVPPGSVERDVDARVLLERARQQRHLATDTRMLTDLDLLEAVTVGETDLLRALHRLPGVAADDDWSAEPWTRGSTWDETRVYYDGLPMLGPVHLGGAFTGVSPDAVGSLTFQPGVRPVDAPEAAAAVVDLRSRPAAGPRALSVLAQASLLSARLSVERPLERGGMSVSGRRSYIDEVTAGGPRAEDHVPIRFSDVASRFDHLLGDSVRLEISTLQIRDRVLGDISGELKGTRADFGNDLWRTTIESHHRGVRTRLTHGSAAFAADVTRAAYDPGRRDLDEAKVGAPMRNRVRSTLTRLTVSPLVPGSAPPGWQLGAERLTTGVSYDGPAPWPYPDAADAGALYQHSEDSRVAYWGRVRASLGPEVDVDAGLRVEADGVTPWDGARLAPRVTVGWRPATSVRVSLAAGRHHQFEQALAATGFVMGPALGPGHLWVSARGRIPPITSDLLTAGSELWLGGTWLLAANAYLRRSGGRLTPAPDSGFVRAPPAVVRAEMGDGWVDGRVAAAGLETTARRLAGRWTGSLSYSWSRARMSAGGSVFPAPGERTHVVDAGILLAATRSTRIGAALTAASGAPYTRFYAFRCPEDRYCPPHEEGAPPVIGFAEPAGEQRSPTYVGLDVHVERSGRFLGLPFGIYLQVRNALGRANRGTYLGSWLQCDEAETECTITDRFEDGFPMLPLFGFWIRL